MSTQNNNISNETEIEILEYSYWEHFRYAKDIALILPIEHPKRKKVEDELNKLQKRLQELKDNKK
jgi:hypothetical protein